MHLKGFNFNRRITSIPNGIAVVDWLSGEGRLSFDQGEDLKGELPRFHLAKRIPPLSEEETAALARIYTECTPGQANAEIEDAVRLREVSREDADRVLEMISLFIGHGFVHSQPTEVSEPRFVM